MTSLATRALERAQALIPTKLKATFFLRAFGYLKVPLIAWVGPVVEELDADHCVVRIPLKRRTKNHVNSLYIAVFTVGADVTGGMLAMETIRATGNRVILLFKDMQADFLARAEDDVRFVCTEGAAVRAAVEQAMASGERVNVPVHIVATVPRKRGDTPVARFTMTLTLKRSDKPMPLV